MPSNHDLQAAVRFAAGRPEVHDAVNALYADLQRQIDARRPLCELSGRCCNFDAFGHRLYVTTMELATFIHSRPTSCPPVTASPSQPSCPFQINRLCSVHAIRPFGCRIFFCDATAQQWQQDLYEQFHARFRRLHDDLSVPYHYVEWRQALATVIDRIETRL